MNHPQLALVQWKTHLLPSIQGDNNKLTGAVLQLIERQRSGEVIDQTLLEKVVGSLVSLGVDSDTTDPNNFKECIDRYREHSEMPLKETVNKE